MDLSDDVLREHRAHISRLEPSLPARAGRHYAKLYRVYQDGIETATWKYATGVARRVHVVAVSRPEPDLHKLSGVLISMAEPTAAKNKDRKQ